MYTIQWICYTHPYIRANSTKLRCIWMQIAKVDHDTETEYSWTESRVAPRGKQNIEMEQLRTYVHHTHTHTEYAFVLHAYSCCACVCGDVLPEHRAFRALDRDHLKRHYECVVTNVKKFYTYVKGRIAALLFWGYSQRNTSNSEDFVIFYDLSLSWRKLTRCERVKSTLQIGEQCEQ